VSFECESMLMLRARLCDQIEALANNFSQLTPRQIVQGIDEVRVTALDHGLESIAGVARGFERALVNRMSAASAAPYFEALRAATECKRLNAVDAETLLAAISVRLYG